MRSVKNIVLLLAALGFLASPAVAAPKKKTKPKKAVPARVIPVEQVFKTSSAPISPEARIFLVAGSSLAASFANEVLEQRRLWLAAGFKESQIACYYVVPLQEDFNDDQKEFLAAAPELARCYPTSVKLLKSHLATVARAHPPFVYLYVSSHGDKPATETLKEARPTDDDYWALQRDARYEAFNQYQLLVEGLTDGTATSTELLGALRGGVPADELFLTPRYLKAALAREFADVPKFLVLQGCFSGGFIEDPAAERKGDLLTGLRDVVVLTAARHDRSSFGCEPGGHTTFFGEAYNAVLAPRLTDPRGISWVDVYADLKKRIELLEKREKMSPPSLPQYFSNYAAPRR